MSINLLTADLFYITIVARIIFDSEYGAIV